MDITDTSREAGRPLSKLGRKMSAGRGRDLEAGKRDGSFHGAKAAVCAAENNASRLAL